MKLDLLSIDQVAVKIDVTRTQVKKYLDDGRIPAIEIGGRRFVERRHAKKPTPKKPGPQTAAKLPPAKQRGREKQ